MDSVLKDSYLASFYHPPSTKALSDLLESRSSSRKLSSSTVTDANSPSYNVLEVPNSKALVSALKTLQEKISRLELDKCKAPNSLASLPMENCEHMNALPEKEKCEAFQREAAWQKNDVVAQLNSAEQRCSLLEKQLDYMRKMVQSAEMEKNTVLEQQTFLQQGNIQDKLEKLEFLEKECLRLTATQQAAENKIYQLEEKLYAEEHQRKLMETKAVQLESGLEVNRIFLSAAAQNASQRKVKKKRQLQPNKPAASKPTLRMSLKAGDLPFVAGKSTSSSHSLSANVQSVMHMIKHQSQSPRTTQTRSKSAEYKPVRPTGPSRTSACLMSSTGDSLTDLLLALQGELEDMNCEHDELLKQINETKDITVREDLEREMECLVKQMETKSDQILKLKRHQQNVLRLKKAARSMKKLSSKARSAVAGQSTCRVECPITPRKKPEASASSTPTPNGKAALQLLKNVQKIQTNLKKDDIMWEK